jgi:PAS domain S-box-containing protein
LSRCSPVGIFTTDMRGAFTYVNPKFQQLSGYNFESSVDYWLRNAVQPEHCERARAVWHNAAADVAEVSTEFPIVLNGATRLVRLTAAPMTAAAGSHIGYVGTLEDVTGLQAARTT